MGSSPGLARGSVAATKLVTLMMGRLGWRNSHWTNGVVCAVWYMPTSRSPYMVSIGVLRWLARLLASPVGDFFRLFRIAVQDVERRDRVFLDSRPSGPFQRPGHRVRDDSPG